MIVNRFALKRQSTVLAFLVILIIVGLYSYFTLPREAFPDITIPYVFVTTTYEGVAPEDMEKLITIPIERKLKGLSDVEKIGSTSEEGLSSVAIEFMPTVDIDDAVQKVRDKVNEAKNDLPPDMPDDPVIEEINMSDIPVIRVVLSGPFSLRRIKTFADDLEEHIESIPGVLDARVTGGLEREIHVEFDLNRVAAYNVPFSSLINAVQRGNVNMPSGSMDIGPTKYLVRIPEDFKHPSEIFSLIAFVNEGRQVYLRDLAFIQDSYKDPLTRSRLNSQQSVTIAVIKRSGENVIRITDEVKRIVDQMRPILPPTLKIDLTSDMSREVRIMVADLENNIISGLILVLLLLLISLGKRPAIFVSLAIPFSMLITFALLTILGITLNMVVLFSLIVAVGMLVDNAIVIVENIYRHMQEGKTRSEAARIGTDEVAWPVISSTMVTLGGFIPLLFWPGIMGEFMYFFPLTLIIALSASLFVAIVINPVISARYQTAIPLVASHGGPEQYPLVKRTYHRLLVWALEHRPRGKEPNSLFSRIYHRILQDNRLIVILSAFALLIVSCASFVVFGKGMEFFPKTDPQSAYVLIKAPEGTNLDASDKLVSQVETIVSGYKDIRHVISNIGSVGGDPFSQGGTGTHLNRVVIDFKDLHDRSRPSSEIVTEVRKRVLAAIKGAEVQVEEEEHGPPTGPPVNIEISGKDILVLGELAERVRKEIADIPGLVDLKDNFVRGKPEIKVRVDKEKAALLGLDTYTIAYTVKAAINGVKVGVYREGKEEYDIIARLPERDRHSVESLRRITISGPRGEPIPLTSVADVSLSSGIGAIMRLDQKRVVTVSANASGRLANKIIQDIKTRLATFDWPRGYSYAFTGEQKEQDKARNFLSKAFLGALFIIFLVLLVEFNAISVAFIIMTSVILSFIGVFWGLLICGLPFGIIMTGVAVISLAGVVANNAIVLIDYYYQLMARGLPARDALIEAGITRLRPVTLGAITTVVGLIPTAIGVSFDFRKMAWDIGGEPTQWWGPMAIAVIFGGIVATLLTLVVVPTLCSLTYDLQTRSKDRS